MTLVTRVGICLVALAAPLIAVSAEGDSPHWTGNGCMSCHSEAAPTGKPANVSGAGVAQQCETCHSDRGNAVQCSHSSDIPAGNVAIPDSLAGSLQESKVVCSTCHDVVYQCERPKIHFSFQNPGFLRDRSSRDTADYCYKCHDGSGREKLNPHAGVAGSSADASCLLCHDGMPESADIGNLRVAFNMNGNLNDQCTGCHNSRPHPRSMSFGNPVEEESWVHLVQPSAAVLENMRDAQASTGVILPLNPQNGEVFCATCHNPHHFSTSGEQGIQTAQTKSRLRMDNICQVCHDK